MFFSIIGVLVFLVISALIAAAEVAFFSLEPSDLETLHNSSSTQEKRIIELLNRQKKTNRNHRHCSQPSEHWRSSIIRKYLRYLAAQPCE